MLGKFLQTLFLMQQCVPAPGDVLLVGLGKVRRSHLVPVVPGGLAWSRAESQGLPPDQALTRES